MKNKLLKYILLSAFLSGSLSSCKKLLDKDPINQLNTSQVYLNVSDADAAVIGLYGKFQGLAERYMVLNELRGDLVEYTTNADDYLRQLSTHNVSPDNPYANPRPFYELILDCNDVLKNFLIMRQQNKMKQLEFDQRYADVVCLRSFLYLQLGIHWGEVPYITDPLESVDAARNAARYPRLPFTTLLDSLITTTEAVVFKDQYPVGFLNTTVDGYNTARLFINKKCLLGDLRLWRGNYREAASWYRQVMETATSSSNVYYNLYKIGWSNATEEHSIQYGKANDPSTLVTEGQGWRYMFERGQDAAFNNEWIWFIPFDSKFAPENPFVKLFSPINGSYLLKPSEAAISYWNSQTQRSSTTIGPGLPYDARGLLSWKNLGGKPTIMKFLYNYISNSINAPVNPFQKNSKWFLFRTAQLHMRFSEAANREGRGPLAYALLNAGFVGSLAPPAGVTDVTNYENTLYDVYPYNFDGRNGDIPYYRGGWYRSVGIRQRAHVNDLVLTAVTPVDSVLQIEDGLLQEMALETAFEGTRWPDLLRIALRRNDPSVIADKIYNKLQKDGVGGASEARSKLMNKANWYLPFNL